MSLGNKDQPKRVPAAEDCRDFGIVADGVSLPEIVRAIGLEDSGDKAEVRSDAGRSVQIICILLRKANCRCLGYGIPAIWCAMLPYPCVTAA